MAGIGFAKPVKKTAADKERIRIEKFKATQQKMSRKSGIKKAIKEVKDKKEKKPSIKKIKKACDTLFSKIVRTRDKFCQKCGSEHSLQNSHTIPRSASKYLYFDEVNCIALCKRCHFYWWHKHPLEAAEWFKEKFSDRLPYLEENKDKLAKMTMEDYTELK